MESILSTKEESIRPDPLPESDSPSEPAPEKVSAADDKGEKPEPAAAKPAAKTAPKVEVDDEPEDEGPPPADLEGYEKALKKARGDGRKYRSEKAQFRKQVEEERAEKARLEGELRAFRAQMQAQAQHQPQRPAEPSSEDLANEYWQDPVAFTQKLLKSSVPDVNAVATRQRADLSEFYAKKAHTDYDERFAYFKDKAAKDPSVWQGIFESASPAETLYQRAIAMQEREEFEQNPDAWREAEREKLRAELSGQEQDAEPKAPAQRPTIPKSNATGRGSGNGVPRSGEWSGPRSLDSIFGHQ